MIRHAESGDIEAVCALYAQARAFMAENGNPGQWGAQYPPVELIQEDLDRGELYVNCGEEGQIDCVFMYTLRPEPSYAQISGQWLNSAPYGTIHRVAASGRRRGAASECIQWCIRESGGNLRGDTHADNRIMQHVFEKNGLRRCGTVTLEDGTERIAYQSEV